MSRLCQSANCPRGNPPSSLQCPKCEKLGISSYFCGQDCFKASWAAHKRKHQDAAALAEGKTYNPFPNLRFTGALRPAYPLSPKRQVPAHIPRPDYADREDGWPAAEQTRLARTTPTILTKEEQEKMRVVCRLGREVLDITAAAVRPGITTDELDAIAHQATVERNAYPSPLNYREFPKSICTSVNEVICHGIPDKRPLEDGDIVNIDVSIYHDGFHADLNGTYPVGTIDDESKKLIRTTRAALDAAIAICKPGALIRDIGKAIEPIAKANGCAVVRAFTGHGTNRLFHCAPDIPHYAKNKAAGAMKAGMCFTIEPMLNLGTNWEEVHWPDNWTATTIDGRRSAQFEELLLITDDGCEVLTAGAPFQLD